MRIVSTGLVGFVGALIIAVAGVSASQTVTVDHMTLSVGSPVSAGADFVLVARAYDSSNHLLSHYNGAASFTDASGELAGAPTSFTNGVAKTTSASIADPYHADVVYVFSGGAVANSQLFNVFGPLDHLRAWVVGPVSAGAPFTVAANALDSAGNVTRYNGAVTFSDSFGELDGAPTSFTNGVAKTTSASIADPQHADQIRVSSGGMNASTTVFNVFGPLDRLRAWVVGPVSAGAPFTVTANALDSAGNVTLYTGAVTFGDSSGELAGAPTSFTNGVAKTTSASIADPQHADQISVSSGGMNVNTQVFNVFGPLDHFDVVGPVGPIFTGDQFTVTATARDSAGNPLKAFAGSATWSDTSGSLAPFAPSNFAAGVSTTNGASVSSPQSGDTITIESGGKQGTSAAFDVNSPNHPPTDISLDNASVAENQAVGSLVGNLSTTDPDAGQNHFYSLVNTGPCPGPDNSSFRLSDASVVTREVFDYETKSSYKICVRTTDNGTPAASFDKQFTIQITNVNEPPTNILLDNSSINEGQASGAAVGNLSDSGDPDAGESRTFSLVTSGCGGSFPDSSSFQVSGGQLQSAAVLDYEAQSSYTICVRDNDPGSPSLSSDKQFTIQVNDVDSGPVVQPHEFDAERHHRRVRRVVPTVGARYGLTWTP